MVHMLHVMHVQNAVLLNSAYVVPTCTAVKQNHLLLGKAFVAVRGI